MDAEKKNGFSQVLEILPQKLKLVLEKCPDDFRNSIQEIRLRAGMPLVLRTEKGGCFLTCRGKTTQLVSQDLLCPMQSEIDDIVQKACGYSVHSHQEEFKNGFLTLQGGHRIGLCGTAVSANDGTLVGIRDIYALNIRIAKQIDGASYDVLKTCFAHKTLPNLLLLGPPCSGKTTVLRDLCKQISNGYLGKTVSCAVIDERGELMQSARDSRRCRLGLNTDILSGYKKQDGIRLAVRSLSPQMVFCDEIGSLEDAEAIADGMLSGVAFVMTAHAESAEQAKSRIGIKKLFDMQLLDYVVVLGNDFDVGQIREIRRTGDYVETAESAAYLSDRTSDGALFCTKNAAAC